jgi:hypothetical protein
MEKTPKNPKLFCEKCRFSSANKKDFDRHLGTAKHKNDNEDNEKTPKNPTAYKCACSKSFVYSSGLSRHKKKCTFLLSKPDDSLVVSSLGVDIEKSGDDLYKLLKEMVISQSHVIELLQESAKKTEISNTITNCNNNNKITINMFLNEKCKDAITFQDFVKSIQPTVEDVLYMTKHGNAQGLTKIITSALGQLEITERPLHCTDMKRHTTYVKESEGWTKEHDQTHIKRLCNTTQHECMKIALNILDEDIIEENEDRLKMMTETTKEPTQDVLLKTLESNVRLEICQ